MANTSSIHIKPKNKGKLHRALGVPEGEKIPAGKLAKAKDSSSPAMRKMANFAAIAKTWKHAGKKGGLTPHKQAGARIKAAMMSGSASAASAR